MNLPQAPEKARILLAIIILLQLAFYASTFSNISVFRQVIGFIYLTFVPGFVIIQLLRLQDLEWTEIILFSAGLSIAFLTFTSLMVNELGFMLGLSRPLELTPLAITLNSIILALAIGVFWRKQTGTTTTSHEWPSPRLLCLLVLPVLSIVGTFCMNAYNSNLVLLSMLVATSVLFVAIALKQQLAHQVYAVAILAIAFSLLLHSSLISNYIVTLNSDVPVEYSVFRFTMDNAHWSSTTPYYWDLGYGRTNSMLSVTILPTVYSTLLGIDPQWVLKILIPAIFALVPLALYQFWQKYVGRKYAFIAAFLFMAQSTFYTEMLALNRQMIAELFFALLLMLVLSAKINPTAKAACFIIFSVALVVSHYSLAEIFFFLMVFAIVSLTAFKHPSRKITLTMIVFFFVAMFSWYIYTSRSAAFESLIQFGNYVYGQIGEFFNPASRGQVVLRGLGLESTSSIWNLISRVFAYATQLLIVLGFIGLLTKRERVHFDREFFSLSLVAIGFLCALIIVPGLANTLNMTRFYHILLFFLAPFCVIGAIFVVRLLFKTERKYITAALLVAVLLPYFLFQTGFVYEVARSDSWSLPLSEYRLSPFRLYGDLGYIDALSVFGAQWLSRNTNLDQTRLDADLISQMTVLPIYGKAFRIYDLTNTTQPAGGEVVYLSTLNTVNGVISGRETYWNTSELTTLFDNMNLIYSNGGSQIYRSPEG